MHPIFRREVAALFLIQIFGVLTLTMFGTYFGIKLDRLGASALVIGLVFASRNFIQIFLRVPFSELSQSVGRKPLIIAGVFCYALSHAFLYYATHWIIVLMGTLVLGTGMSLHWPAVFSYIGDIAEHEYGRINGIILQGQDIGVIAGSMLASYLLNHDIVSLKGLFGILFLIGMGGVFLTVVILPEVLDDQDRKVVTSKLGTAWDSFRNTIGSFTRLTKQYPLGLIYIFEFIVTFTQFFLASFFPLLVVISYGYDDGDVANIVLYSTMITVFLKPYFGIIFDRRGYRWPILIALSICSVMYYLLTLDSNFWYLLIIYTIAISSIFVCFIATTGATSNNALSSDRGLAMGVLGVYIASGRALSSIVLAPVLGIFEKNTGSRAQGLKDLFQFTALLIIILVILLYLGSELLERRNRLNAEDHIS